MQADDFILKLPSTPFNNKEGLPKHPGIYYVIDDKNHDILYIGKSVNINSRWLGRGHHREDQLNSLRRSRKTTFTIYHEFVKVEFLKIIEQNRINQYDPLLNESPVKTRNVLPAEQLLRESLAILQENIIILGVEPPRKEIANTLENANGRNNLTRIYILNSPVIHLLLTPNDPSNFWLFKKYLLGTLLKRTKHSRYSKQWSRIYSNNRDFVCHRFISNGYIFELTEWWYWNNALQNKIEYQNFMNQITTIDATLAKITLKALSQESFSLLTPDPKNQSNPVHYLLERLTPYTQEVITLTSSSPIQISFNQSNTKKVKEEIKRVLTRINTLTTLFSELRSLVIGEYLEGENRCIVIAVHTNEWDIFNTSQKKGKGGWFMDSINYEFDEISYQITILKYVVDNYQFEFISFSQIIDYMRLEDRLKEVKSVTILDTEVKALSSIDFLDNLLYDSSIGRLNVHDSYWFTRARVVEEGSYIFHLRDKLKPLEGEEVTKKSAPSTVKIISSNHEFTDIDSLLVSRGKPTEINNTQFIRKSGFVRQSGNRKYVLLLVSSFMMGNSSYYSVYTIDNNQKVHNTNSANCQVVYLLCSGNEKLWLLLEDELREFVKLGTLGNLSEGECYTNKLYFSPRRYVRPARLNIKIKAINYSSSLPFGASPNYPHYVTAITEIEKRIKALNIPTLQCSFTQEKLKS